MLDLVKFEFTCPFCAGSNDPEKRKHADRVTFITKEKLNEVIAREKLIQNIFSPQFFPAAYRETFVSRLCDNCKKETFNLNKNEPSWDVEVNEDTKDLEARISEMYENTRE